VPVAELVLACAAILLVALLYSSAGQAGASGYIAVMALFGFAEGVIKPTALALNIVVAVIASAEFGSAGHFSWRLFWPFAAGSVPLAFVGGYLDLPMRWFRVLVGLVLLYSATRFLIRPAGGADVKPPDKGVALTVGGGIGLLSGLTGTGGGIFLAPLLVLLRWARTKTAAATSAVFILANSIAGLAGNMSATRSFPRVAIPFAVCAVAGGTVGSYLGSRKLDVTLINRVLAVVLAIAGFKLIFT
jgi:uncharacterized membrane protein YfcA